MHAANLDGPVSGRRLATWAWAGLSTTVAQSAVQGFAFLAGILVVRMLPPRQYAYYTIVTAGLGTMTVLTDCGVSNSVLALGGAAWRDRIELGSVVATGLALRRRFAFFALLAAVPIMSFLLHRQGAGWMEAVFIGASLTPLFLATVTGHLLEAVPRLHQTLARLQSLQLAANAARLALIALLVRIWPTAVAAVLVAAAPQWLYNWRLRRMAAERAEWRVSASPRVAARIVAQVRRTMPGAIHYAVSGQLMIWLIAFFGHSASVAAVGALGRLAMILTVAGYVFNALAVPRFARIPSPEGTRVHRRYFQAQLVLAAVCAAPVAALIAFPGPALAILGGHYRHLEHEAVLMGLSAAAVTLSGAAYTLGAARGVIAPPVLMVPYTILGQVVLVASLPLDSIDGVIWVSLASALSQWLFHVVYFEWCHRKRRESQQPNAELT